MATGRQVVTLPLPRSEVRGLAFSPDGRSLAAAVEGKDQGVKVWDAATGEARFSAEAGEGAGGTNGVAFSPDGRYLALAANGAVRVWEWQAKRLAFDHPAEADFVWAGFSAGGDRLLTGDRTGTVRVFDWAAGREVESHHGPADVGGGRITAYSPDGGRFAWVETINDRFLDVCGTTDDVHFTLSHELGIRQIAFSADGRRLASVGSTG